VIARPRVQGRLLLAGMTYFAQWGRVHGQCLLLASTRVTVCDRFH